MRTNYGMPACRSELATGMDAVYASEELVSRQTETDRSLLKIFQVGGPCAHMPQLSHAHTCTCGHMRAHARANMRAHTQSKK